MDDPEVNYTTPINQASGLRLPEYVVRQLLSFSLQNITQHIDDTDTNIIDQLFRLAPDDVRVSVKRWFRTHPNIVVGVNWPREGIALPHIAIVTESSDEDESSALLGDYGGVETLGSADDGRITEQTYSTLPERYVTSVYVATDDPNMTLFLTTIVKYILLSNKTNLQKYTDVYNLSLSTRDIKLDVSLFPAQSYTRMVQMNYLTWFDFNTDPATNKIVSLGLMVNTVVNGELVTVDVPSE